MNEVSVLTSFSALIVSGYFMLLTMARHRLHIQPNSSVLIPNKRRRFRAWASTCLLLSIFPIGAGYGWSIGSVYWFGLLNIVILILALLLNYAAFSIRWLALSSSAVGLIGTVILLG